MRSLSVDELETALTIDLPLSDGWNIDECRRLTGPGLLWKRKGAIIDIFDAGTGFDHQAFITAWDNHARRVLNAVGWSGEHINSRVFDEGVNLAVSAPSDVLYSAIFVAETACHFAAHDVLGSTPNDFDGMIADLKRIITVEVNPPLIALEQAAKERKIDFLCDDDEVSIGHCGGSKVWPVDQIPAPSDIDFEASYNIPVAMITGTNGKSTSVRISAAIAEAAGKIAGTTSTDYVKIGDDILDQGDYSGPGGARMLLRDRRPEIAFLETARGGILRRGLPLYQAQAAIVTNIAPDHLGQYGVNTVEALAEAKFAVARTLASDGTLVLNADDPLVVANGLAFERTKCWFSLDPNNEQIVGAKQDGSACCWLDGDMICYFDGLQERQVISASAVPITMGGAARFNIRNIMGAICLTTAMGIKDDAIRGGLMAFRSEPDQNPGRCNEFDYRGAKVYVDYAHNEHSVTAVCEALGNLPAKKRYVMISHSGDRSDSDIHNSVIATLAFKPDVVVAADLEAYLRGRHLGEVPALIKNACIEAGMAEGDIWLKTSPQDGARAVLDAVSDGDLALLIVLSDRDAVFEMLREEN